MQQHTYVDTKWLPTLYSFLWLCQNIPIQNKTADVHLTQTHTWTRSRGGHVVDEVLEGCPYSDVGVVHGGVLLIGHSVVDDWATVAEVEDGHQHEAQHTDWHCDHCGKAHWTKCGGLHRRNWERKTVRGRKGVNVYLTSALLVQIYWNTINWNWLFIYSAPS